MPVMVWVDPGVAPVCMSFVDFLHRCGGGDLPHTAVDATGRIWIQEGEGSEERQGSSEGRRMFERGWAAMSHGLVVSAERGTTALLRPGP